MKDGLDSLFVYRDIKYEFGSPRHITLFASKSSVGMKRGNLLLLERFVWTCEMIICPFTRIYYKTKFLVIFIHLYPFLVDGKSDFYL